MLGSNSERYNRAFIRKTDFFHVYGVLKAVGNCLPSFFIKTKIVLR